LSGRSGPSWRHPPGSGLRSGSVPPPAQVAGREVRRRQLA
jgi:hypothetical protein